MPTALRTTHLELPRSGAWFMAGKHSRSNTCSAASNLAGRGYIVVTDEEPCFAQQLGQRPHLWTNRGPLPTVSRAHSHLAPPPHTASLAVGIIFIAQDPEANGLPPHPRAHALGAAPAPAGAAAGAPAGTEWGPRIARSGKPLQCNVLRDPNWHLKQ